MELQSMKRSELTELINKKKDSLKDNLFMINSVRPTRDKSLQVEVCMHRNLGGRAKTLLGLLNKSSSKFRGESTLLFDWLTFEPQDFKDAFPETEISLEDLNAIAELWDPNAETGTNSTVFPILDEITAVHDKRNGVQLKPTIVVTEVVESSLAGGFFKGKDAEEKAKDVIKNSSAVMRTGSEKDAEYIVDPENGEKIYRFTRTMLIEEGKAAPEDTMIEGKITESQYKKQNTGSAAKAQQSGSLKDMLLKQDTEIN